MKEIQSIISMFSCHKSEIKDSAVQALIAKAIDYLEVAYAPYSNFLVGAAILDNQGQLFGGANQENASYPLCMCGERNALYHHAMASPSTRAVAVAITAKSPTGPINSPIMPCGACAQVLLEYERRYGVDLPIYLITDDEMVYLVKTPKSLLPYGFDDTYL